METTFTKPLNKEVIQQALDAMGVQQFDKATIVEIARIGAYLKNNTPLSYIKLEVGIPGLTPPSIGIEAQIAALQNGVAQFYPDCAGIKPLKTEASRFVKAFMNVDVDAQGCIPVCGSMQGAFASFMLATQLQPEKQKVLFIDPGFPDQKAQCAVLGIEYEHFDLFKCRGEKFQEELESYLQQGDIAAIIYSNPNNPTWVCLQEEELEIIGRLAKKYDAIVIEDLAYFGMDFRKDLGKPFEPPYQLSVAHYTDNYILLISASKAFSYAGERIGVACISDNLYHRAYPTLTKRYHLNTFGQVFVLRFMDTLSTGVSQSAQHALTAMFKASSDGLYNFRDNVLEYGRRAARLKEIFLRHGFHIVYDKDLDMPLADGFYFTLGYKNLTGPQLAYELLRYGVSTIPLNTSGSEQQGIRICTSFMRDDQYDVLEERMQIFEQEL